MKRKWIFVVAACLLLVSCNSLKRSDVVDILIDNNYIRNNAGYYEKYEDNYFIRIGYRSSIAGYLESLRNYIGPGPIVLVDFGNNMSFNYHLNEDVMLYNVYCVENDLLENSEVMYSFADESFIVGDDGCKFDVENQEPLITEFKAKRDLMNSELDKMSLNKKKLSLLK